MSHNTITATFKFEYTNKDPREEIDCLECIVDDIRGTNKRLQWCNPEGIAIARVDNDGEYIITGLREGGTEGSKITYRAYPIRQASMTINSVESNKKLGEKCRQVVEAFENWLANLHNDDPDVIGDLIGDYMTMLHQEHAELIELKKTYEDYGAVKEHIINKMEQELIKLKIAMFGYEDVILIPTIVS